MKIGIIGCGNMGSAILSGALKAKAVIPSDIWIRNSSYTSSFEVAQKLGGHAAESLEDLIAKSEVLILGTKPGLIPSILGELNQHDLGGKLIISIAAGVSIDSIEGFIGKDCRIIRTMPNTPTLVGEGAIGYSMNQSCTTDDENKLVQLLENSATLSNVPESLMDSITGLSGSGPAYVYTFIEALADGAVKEGLPRPQALKLAAKTVLGGAKMVLESGTHPSLLRDQVASPGGTTIAGIASLEENGFRNATIKAVQAAAKRSRELG